MVTSIRHWLTGRAARGLMASAVLAASFGALAGPAAASGEVTAQANKWVTTVLYAGIINHANNRFLDSNDNGDVYTLPWNGGDYQKWYMDRETDSMGVYTRKVRFRNLKTGKCLDNYPGRVYTNTCNGGLYQIWYQYPDNVGRVFKNMGTQRCMDSNLVGNVYDGHVCQLSDLGQNWSW